MWWWGPGPWWPWFGLMVVFMLLCGAFMARMGGRRGVGGMCGWSRGREHADPTHGNGQAQRPSDREEQVPHQARPDRRLAR
jgi:hypothetical protein